MPISLIKEIIPPPKIPCQQILLVIDGNRFGHLSFCSHNVLLIFLHDSIIVNFHVWNEAALTAFFFLIRITTPKLGCLCNLNFHGCWDTIYYFGIGVLEVNQEMIKQ